MADQLKKDYAGNAEGLENLVKSLPIQKLIVDQLSDSEPLADKYRGKNKTQLFNENLLEDLKREYPAHFENLMKGENK